MKDAISRKKLYQSVKDLIDKAQHNAVRSVNTTMLITYFEIGRMIIEIEQQGNTRAEYAKQTLENLSTHLTREFGKGYSTSNLEYMSNFYKIYQERIQPISQSVIGKLKKDSSNKKSQSVIGISEKSLKGGLQPKFPFQLSLTHYIQLLKIKNEDERNFYEIKAISNNLPCPKIINKYLLKSIKLYCQQKLRLLNNYNNFYEENILRFIDFCKLCLQITKQFEYCTKTCRN